MELKEETVTFFTFIIVGIIIGIVFDFFRALRRVKKYNEKYICVQDILFFIIISIVLMSTLIYKLEYSLRLYLFFSLFLGIVIYISTISSYVMKIYISFIKIFSSIICFVLMPINMYKQCFMTIYNFLVKKSKKCCNKFHNMISYLYKQYKYKLHKIKIK